VVIFAVPLLLERQRRHAEASRAIFVLMLTFVACFATYVAFPVAGPRYLWTSAAEDVGGLSRLFATWVLESQSSRGTAFPSSHVAVSMTQAALAVVYFGRRGLIVAGIAVLLAIGAVYGGFHYLIDIVVGVVYSAIFTALGYWLLALGERPIANSQ
jgi:membrane-associated phospholipid phosphatase